MKFFKFFFVGSFEDSFRNSSYPRITREIIISSLFKIKVIPQSFKMKASINEPENPQRNAKRKTYKQITMRHVSEKKKCFLKNNRFDDFSRFFSKNYSGILSASLLRLLQIFPSRNPTRIRSGILPMVFSGFFSLDHSWNTGVPMFIFKIICWTHFEWWLP